MGADSDDGTSTIGRDILPTRLGNIALAYALDFILWSSHRSLHDFVIAIGTVLAALAISRVAYRGAVGTATRLGEKVRASIDLHRLELYERFGLKAPASLMSEEVSGRTINELVLRGTPIPDEVRARPSSSSAKC